MSWNDATFPNADDPNEVGWLISYWRIRPCYGGCGKQDYVLESRQFDHLVKAATRDEALAKFNVYVAQKRLSGKLSDLKGLVLFLSRVDTMVVISDVTGEIVR